MGKYQGKHHGRSQRLYWNMTTNNVSVKQNKNVPQQKEALVTLNYIHNQFIVIQTDKANDNYAYISFLCYGLVLVKELGLDQKTNNIN